MNAGNNLRAYEAANNWFLRELRGGGALASLLSACRPFDAVLVPPQRFFWESAAGASTSMSKGSATTAASGNSRGDENGEGGSDVRPAGVHQSAAFLYRHVIRFADPEHLSTQFVTLDNMRGIFSDDLREVTLSNAAPGEVQTTRTALTAHVLRHCPPEQGVSAAELHNNAPQSLNVFLISEPIATGAEIADMAATAVAASEATQRQTESELMGGVAAQRPSGLGSALDVLFSGLAGVFDTAAAATAAKAAAAPERPATRVGCEGTTESPEKRQQQQQPTSRFHIFQKRMQLPESKPVVRLVSQFIQAQLQREEPTTGVEVQECVRRAMTEMRNIPAWNVGDDATDIAADGLEKYITTKLYSKCFCVNPSERRDDATLTRKLAALQRVVKPRHLECAAPPADLRDWARAKEELNAMQTYKSPRDKLRCASAACIHIANAMRGGAEALAAGRGDLSDKGADEYLPCVLLCVLEANPKNFISNLRFITEMRSEDRIDAEAQYHLTVLQSAAQFWLTCQASQLKMTTEEFDVALNNIFALRRSRSESTALEAAPAPVRDGGDSGGDVPFSGDASTSMLSTPTAAAAVAAPAVVVGGSARDGHLEREIEHLRGAVRGLLSALDGSGLLGCAAMEAGRPFDGLSISDLRIFVSAARESQLEAAVAEARQALRE